MGPSWRGAPPGGGGGRDPGGRVGGGASCCEHSCGEGMCVFVIVCVYVCAKERVRYCTYSTLSYVYYDLCVCRKRDTVRIMCLCVCR